MDKKPPLLQWRALYWGLLITGGPIVFLLLNDLCTPRESPYIQWANIILSTGVFIGLILLTYRPTIGQYVTSIALTLSTGWAIYFLIDAPGTALTCLIILTLSLIGLWSHIPQKPISQNSSTDIWNQILHHPGRFLVTTFLCLSFVGGLVLSLPVCNTRPLGITFLDGLFTSISATCVTGLIVLDTPVDFTFTGQAVILLLIQIGGLGIMTFYATAVLLLRQRMSIKEEGTAAELLGSKGRSGLLAALRSMLIITFAIECIGALVLAGLFWHQGDAPSQAIWRGMFTSISAYCNAGFALQSDSLIPYQTQPFILNTIALLIIFGGLGPTVIIALPNIIAKRQISLHAHLALTSTFFFLLIPTFLFAATEWSNTLSNLTVWDHLSNAFFQSVTTRTAGFNAIDLSVAHPATLTLTEGLMFIGGSPGSTAGGIKTTTAALLFLSIIATLRGRPNITAFGWCIPQRSIYKALTIFMLGLLGAGCALMALLLTQPISFHMALFEIVSALGTVGLSIGATGLLDGVGKIIIMVCMFVGRVGMLTLLLSLSEHRTTSWTLPEQDVIVG